MPFTGGCARSAEVIRPPSGQPRIGAGIMSDDIIHILSDMMPPADAHVPQR